ncbi:hypothetical protein FACS1894184_13790 [Clostridia bacterium]|nr:hypothetical protein FACS1894184_13790 [Clostridia bacterium]
MDTAAQTQLNKMVERIISTVPTHTIYLFGSYARGDQRSGSDLDIYVLTDDQKRPIDYIHDIRYAISGIGGIPVDILALPRDRFDQRSRMRPTLEYTVVKEGRRIYG